MVGAGEGLVVGEITSPTIGASVGLSVGASVGC